MGTDCDSGGYPYETYWRFDVSSTRLRLGADLSPAGNLEQAVQFSLSGTESVSTIDVTLLDQSAGNTLTVSLVSSLTGPATTFATFAFTTTNSLSDAFTGTLNQDLAPGTYFLVLSGTGPTGQATGWVPSNGVLTQTAGTVTNGSWTSADTGATWTFFNNEPGTFAVNGTVVPEPSSLLLLGTGLLGLMGMIRKRLA